MQKLILIGRDFFGQMKKKNLSAFSASTAFFLFLSVGPMLAFVCTLIPYLPLTKEGLFATIMQIVPNKMQGVVQNLLAEIYGNPVGIMSVAAIAMIWASGKGTLALMRGLNSIHNVTEERNYFVARFLASVYTLAIAVAIVVSLGLIVFSNQIINTICVYLPQSEVLLKIIAPFRYVVVWVLITVILACIYSYLPSVKLHFKKQLPGAIFAATLWSVFSFGFSVYMNVAELTAIYGSLSILALVLLWLYFGMYIILLGAYFNRYFIQRRTYK